MTPGSRTTLELITPGNRADYRQLVAPLASACWPEFMLHDPVADENWPALFEYFSDYQFGLFDPQIGRAAAMGNSLPLCWEYDLRELPEEGWDWAFEHAVQGHRTGTVPNIQCAVQIAIHPDYRGQGVSSRMVAAMRSVGRQKGFRQMIAPVRPSQKSDYPLTDIDRYVRWTSDGGLPFDAWLRVHARAGAKLVKVCHRSMMIKGTVEEWTAWTGLRFPETGIYAVPGALNSIEVSLEANESLYIEPNVWMAHDLGQAAGG